MVSKDTVKKVLIVDDEHDLVHLVKISLEKNNFSVLTAHDGEEGLDKAKSEQPDLIVLDILMPKKDGWTFMRELKATDGIKNIPVIMLTIREQLKDVFELEGVRDYVVKPFSAEELVTKINTCLKDNEA